MKLRICFLMVLAVLVISSPALAAKKKKKEQLSDLPTTLLIATNQGALQKMTMPSMATCQSVAKKIVEQDDAYGGPALHMYCISDDGQVWGFDRWKEGS